MSKKIILDCDPGHDDAVAILLAVGNPNIDLLGVTTVGGNQSLDKVTYNARAVLEKAHATDVPVHAGCDRPLVRKQEVAASIHGETGLDGVELPEPSRPLEAGHAVNWIIDTIMSNEPGTITLVPTGPLTNIAMAARMVFSPINPWAFFPLLVCACIVRTSSSRNALVFLYSSLSSVGNIGVHASASYTLFLSSAGSMASFRNTREISPKSSAVASLFVMAMLGMGIPCKSKSLRSFSPVRL